jgi:4-diphosphocytidyl-2C-methyl-D-erythritol kinase
MIEIFAPAKLNLCLDIIKKTASGYHEIQTIFQETYTKKDALQIYESKEEDHVSISEGSKTDCTNGLFKMKENLVYKALKLVKQEFKIKKNFKIIIEKEIPFSCGLGGASSDAAATLKGLNVLLNLNLSEEKMLTLGERLGKDVPFFIMGGTALGTNFGEKLTPLNAIKNIKFKILPTKKWPTLPPNLDKFRKTYQMYKNVDLKKCGKNILRTKKLLKAIEEENQKEILINLHNDFETLINTPKGTHLSGSGPAVFEVIL